MLSRSEAVQRAIGIANDDSHGYSQYHRDGNPDFDCSSLGLWVYGLGTDGYSGNICDIFADNGADVMDFDGNLGDLEAGDILVKEGAHVAIYVGDGQVVEASSDENGGIAGDQSGDQTSDEIHIRGVYDFGWNKVISPPHEEQPAGPVVLTTYALVDGVWTHSDTSGAEGASVGDGSTPITGVAFAVSSGDGRYRVHLVNGDWLDWVWCRDCDTGNLDTGMAGDGKTAIDGVQFEYLTPDSIRPYRYAHYHVATIQSGWLDWVRDLESPEGDGFAGETGQAITDLSAYVA